MTTRITAHWLPIMLEPMPGADERFVIGVAAVDRDGQHEIIRAITEATARCMYGNAAPRLLGMVDVTLSSLAAHLSKHMPLHTWRPPMSSQTTAGESHYAEGPDLQTIAREGLSLSSSLAWRLDHVEAEKAPEPNEEPDRWMRELRDTVLETQKHWARRFDRSVSTGPSAPKVRVGYMGERLVAQFVKLTVRGLQSQKVSAKAKVFDLQLARDYQPLVPRDNYEIFVWRRQESASDKSMRSTMRMIEDFCDMHELRMRAFSTTYDAAKHIIATEQR